MENASTTPREQIIKHLESRLLGPGAEFWTDDTQVEWITLRPIKSYVTGILSPRQIPQGQAPLDNLEANDVEDDADEDDPVEAEAAGDQPASEEANLDTDAQRDEEPEEPEEHVASPYNISSMGLTVVVPKGQASIEVTLTGAYYRWLPWDQRTMKLTSEEYNLLWEWGTYTPNAKDGTTEKPIQLKEKYKEIREYFRYDEGNGELKLINKSGSDKPVLFGPYPNLGVKERSPIDFMLLPRENRPVISDNYVNLNIKRELNDAVRANFSVLRTEGKDSRRFDRLKKRLLQLVEREVYQRIPFEETITFDITEGAQNPKKKEFTLVKQGTFDKYELNGKEVFNYRPELKASVVCKVDEKDGSLAVRISLVNETKGVERPTSINGNLRSLYQCQLEVSNADFQRYKPKAIFNEDEEAQELALQFADISAYGVGHNCSIDWELDENKKPTKVKTTWLPRQTVPSITTDIRIEGNDSANAFDLQKLSYGSGFEDDKIIGWLTQFEKSYEAWQNVQENTEVLDAYKSAKASIRAKQKASLDRIKAGIKLLEKDTEVLTSFRIAMLAMRIQMIVSQKAKPTDEIVQNNPVTWELNAFRDDEMSTKLRPFQLGFVLASLEGIVDPTSESRKSLVDVIWFPTGGGKTEAYLALTAFTIIRRVRSGKPANTSVIMRYTLRLLTAQQFERASKLICALEFLRLSCPDYNLGARRITLGMYVGSATTPNRLNQVRAIIDKIQNHGAKENKFSIRHCPACGSPLDSPGLRYCAFYQANAAQPLTIHCVSPGCWFYARNKGKQLPIVLVDEQLYAEPPTLLFGTVDKFAQLVHKTAAKNFFDQDNPPELIIQDELHLISGPLGSMVGAFEAVIESLCQTTLNDGTQVGPKIIASTATTRNSDKLIKAIYGASRSAVVFPAPGLNKKNNFFAKEIEEEDRREYLGIWPTGGTARDAQIKVLAELFNARAKLLPLLETQEDVSRKLDPYYTVLSYYHAVRDLGIAKSQAKFLVEKSVTAFLDSVPDTHLNCPWIDSRYPGQNKARALAKSLQPSGNRNDKELTSRIQSHLIKKSLDELGNTLGDGTNLTENDNGSLQWTNQSSPVNLAFATNMISVGLDVSRLNLMVMNGLPNSHSEYIQATSRVGRRDKGLSILICNPYKSRENSLFPQFKYYHKSLYQQVEPISATPYAEELLLLMLPSIFVAYMRHHHVNADNITEPLPEGATGAFVEMISTRLLDADRALIERLTNRLAAIWNNQVANREVNNLVIGVKDGRNGNYNFLLERMAVYLRNNVLDITSFDKNDCKIPVIDSLRMIDDTAKLKIQVANPRR